MSRSQVALAACLFAGSYWLLMFVGTHLPPQLDPLGAAPQIAHGDKLVHCLGYAGLAFLLCTAGAACWGFRRSLLALVLVLAMSYAAFDEWSQPFVGRESSDKDWGADVLGIGLGLAAFSLIAEPLMALLGQRSVKTDEPPAAAESVGV
jgi:VanZ family protein